MFWKKKQDPARPEDTQPDPPSPAGAAEPAVTPETAGAEAAKDDRAEADAAPEVAAAADAEPAPPTPPAPAPDQPPAAKKEGFFRRLRKRLNQGDSWLTYDLAHLLPGGKPDEAFLEEMESRLLTSDVGVEATSKIMDSLDKKLWRDELRDVKAVFRTMQEGMLEILQPF